MNLKIVKIIDRGIANKERVWLKSNFIVNLSKYAILKTEYIGINEINNYSSHYLFLPDINVGSGDSIIIYTKSGNYSKVKNTSNDAYTHFVYMGLKNTIFNRPEDCVVLLQLNNWETSVREQ